jgi:hypothetical protein
MNLLLFSLSWLIAPSTTTLAQPPEEPATQPAAETPALSTDRKAARSASEKEVEARQWFNNPVFRLHDERRVELFFFRCEDKETLRWLDKLNRLARRPDTVVIALTRESPASAEKFIDRLRIRFTVGAGSRSAETFAIRDFPALRVIERKDRQKVEDLEFGAVDAAFPSWQRPLDELKGEAALREYVASDADAESREGAVEKLWELLQAEGRAGDFASLADGQLPIEADPFIRAQMRYFGDLARGIPRNDREMSVSTRLRKEYRASPDDPRWAEVRALEDQAKGKAPGKLLELYTLHFGDVPDDVLSRRIIVDEIVEGTRDAANAPYMRAARDVLMQILPAESDHSIRLFATMAFYDTCQVGDIEAADFLDAMAENERNDYTVRPMMEYLAHCLRTGEKERR